MDLILIIILIFICAWGDRDFGYIFDKQNREPEGKPQFIDVPVKWRWMFRFQNETYADGNKILKASVVVHLLGYFFSFLEIIILLCTVVGDTRKLADLSMGIFLLHEVILAIYIFPIGLKYEKNLRKAYDYDWITFVQEIFFENPRRRCKIIEKIDENTYEIKVGRYVYLAKSKKPVNTEERLYAYHRYDEGKPYWIIKNY